MRLPINFLLYLASLAMLGVAGWLFVQATIYARPLSGEQGGPSMEGFKTAERLIAQGRGEEPQADPWNYGTQAWWQQFQNVNLIGKPPPEPKVDTPEPDDTPPPVVEKSLDEIFQMISLMHHGNDTDTHVVIRYRDTADVEVPEPVAAATPSGPTPPAAAQMPGGQRPRGQRPGPAGARGVRPRPISMPPVGAQLNRLVHHLKIGESLWPPYESIKLVRVARDARSAFFQRDGAVDPEGNPLEPEEVFKNEMDLDPELVRQLIEEGRAGRIAAGTSPEPAPRQTSGWVDVPETRQVSPGKFAISRADDQLIRQDPQQLLGQVTIRPYRSTAGNRARDGIQIVSPDPELSRRFGVRGGDVILEVNGTPVRSRTQAIDVGTRLYKQGVREFRVKMMTMGRIEERTYVAPDG